MIKIDNKNMRLTIVNSERGLCPRLQYINWIPYIGIPPIYGIQWTHTHHTHNTHSS